MPADLANFGDIELVSAETAIPLANIIVKLVNHKEFHNIDRGLLADKQVIDTRGVWW
jgi:UDP-N-acetyl-D-mannosaminuronic acid dehydrogenase